MATDDPPATDPAPVGPHEAMVANADEAITLLDDRVWIEANAAALRFFGCTREQLIGHSPLDFSPPLQADGRPSAAAAAERIAAALAGTPQRFEWLHRRADGTSIDAEVALSRVARSDRPHLVAVVRDITGRKAAERALNESRAFLASVFDLLPEPLSLVRIRDGVFVDVNRRWELESGLSRAQVVGQTPLALGLFEDPADRDRLRALFDRKGHVEDLPLRVRRHGGRIVDCEMSASTIQYQGETLAMWLTRDVTERKRAEAELRHLNATLESRVAERTRELAQRNAELARTVEQLNETRDELVRSEKLASLGALVAGVAHELNTPIGNALLVSSTLADRQAELGQAAERGPDPAAVQAYLADARAAMPILERNLARAAELIREFKQLSVDQSSDQRRRFRFDELLRGVLLTLSPMLRRGKLSVVQDLAPELELDSYPGSLARVLENLLLNAMTHAFAPGQGGTVTVRTRVKASGLLLLSVADDGRGMSAEERQHAFDPFFTTRLGSGGSGLGLHLVYTLTTGVLGGRVRIGRAAGRGTEFLFELPLSAPARAPQDT